MMLCDSTRGYVLEVHIPTVEPTYAKSPLALLFLWDVHHSQHGEGKNDTTIVFLVWLLLRQSD